MPTRTFYHGTSSARQQSILTHGLRPQQDPILGGWSSPFVTDSLDAARAYAAMNVRSYGGEAVVFTMQLEFSRQPNGAPAPPFFVDNWHRDSEMPGNAWEYDGKVAPELLCVIEGPSLGAEPELSM